MLSQREWSREDLPAEVRKLNEKLEKLLLGYIAALGRTSHLTGEFDCRYWASRVDLLQQKVKEECQRFQLEVGKVNIMGTFMTRAVDIISWIAGLQPVSPPALAQACLSISSSGEVKLYLKGVPISQPDVVLLSFDEFERLVSRLRGDIVKGVITLNTEDEIPKAIYKLALSTLQNKAKPSQR
jgi:hypothetical protein